MIVIDASAMIGLLGIEDALHHKAEQTIDRALAQNRPLGMSTVTLAETLVTPTRAGRVTATLAYLDRLEVAEVPVAFGSGPRLAELRATTGLKLPDCCVLLAAQDAGAAVLTFDDRLRDAAEQLGLEVVTPAAE